jgi:prepilin-type processing-associated H-X9-DG protein
MMNRPRREAWFWCRVLQPYTSAWWTNDLYRCPANRWRALDTWFDDTYNAPFIPIGSYGYNTYGFADHAGRSQLRPLGLTAGLGPDFRLGEGAAAEPPAVRESQVLAPASMIALADSYVAVLQPDDRLRRPEPASEVFHRTGYQVAFCDGHVEFRKPGQLYSRSDDVRRLWNSDHEPHPEYLP